MAVRDIYGKGGTVPEPGEDTPTRPSPRGGIGERFRDKLDEFTDYKMLWENFGFNKPPPSNADGSLNADVIRRALDDAINTRLAPIENVITKLSQDKERQEFFQNVVDKVRQTVEDGRSPTTDPIDTYQRVGQIFSNMAADIRKNAGVSEAKGHEDYGALMQLEELRAARDERRMQHEELMEQNRQNHEIAMKKADQQWELDKIKWTAEFGLKKEEAIESRKSKEAMLGDFKDLAGSIMDGINAEKESAGVGKQVGASAPPIRQQAQADKFKCACGEQIPVPVPAPDTLVCPKCKAEYGKS